MFSNSFKFTQTNEFNYIEGFKSIPQLDNTEKLLTIKLALSITFTRMRSVTFSISNSRSNSYYTEYNEVLGTFTIISTESDFQFYIPYIIYYYSPKYVHTNMIIFIHKRKRITVEQLVGIICGFTAVFFIILLIIIIVYRKMKLIILIRYQHDQIINNDVTCQNLDNENVSDDLLVKVDETKYSIFLDLANYERLEKISKCDLSKIYKFQEKKTKNIYLGQMSMIKMNNLLDEDLTKLSKELENISKLDHPSLLKFIGYSPIDFKNNRKPVIVTEYASNGSLNDILQIERLNNNSIQEWDETKKLINIYGIASGMSYLHSHDILHCCLKPSTIYLNEILFPKIGDFGLSMKFYNPDNLTIQSISGLQGLPIYSAPEVLQYNTYSKASDVYSFALIVYEIIANEVPFKNINNFHNGNRPELNESIPKKYRELIEKCWCQDPNQRISFEEIAFLLRTDQEFITEKINKDSYLKYIEYIEKSFDHDFNYNNVSSKQVAVIESQMNESISSPQFSIEYYKRNAESGNIEAQEFLFKKFSKENDTENIYKYLCMLIKAGKCDAPIEYAIKLFNAKYYKQAFKYFTAISQVNHPIARYFIGVMKFFGYGCDENHDDSYRIMKDLSNNGIERATEFIEDYFNK